MVITLARHYGFCYGVKRAVEMAGACVGCGPVHTYGPIIHNPQVVEKLAAQGVVPEEDLERIETGTVVFRSHGVAPAAYKQAAAQGLKIIDATCPHVRKAQLAAKSLADSGRMVVVVGEHKHPEVASILAWAGNAALIVESIEEAIDLPRYERLGVVSQTTFDRELLARIIGVLQTKTLDIQVEETVCTATEQRQTAARELAGQVEVMVVVGGKNSANTRHLADVCAQAGARIYHIETAAEVRPEWFSGVLKAGITAGASTPDWIIEEVVRKMQEVEQMTDQEMKTLEAGQIVKGRIAAIRDTEVMVDIGYKSEGIIPLAELAFPLPEKAADAVKENEVIDVLVLDPDDQDGNVRLSKVKADEIVAWDKLQAALDQGTVISGKVTAAVKGGLSVAVFGIRGFVPASQADLQFVADLSTFVDQTLELLPIEIDNDKKRVVLSRRKVLEAARQAKEEEVYKTIAPGQKLKGVVRRLAAFGAFVDIGGVDGLVHISDMSWQRVQSPEEVVKVGDEVEVTVLKVDPAAHKISLSLKDAAQDPWLDKVGEFAEGMTVKGKVTKLAKFGAFVEIKAGLEGLVHISEISDHRIATPGEVLEVGQDVQVKILGIDKKAKKLSLSISGAKQDEDRAEYKHYLQSQGASLNVTLGDRFGHLFKRED